MGSFNVLTWKLVFAEANTVFDSCTHGWHRQNWERHPGTPVINNIRLATCGVTKAVIAESFQTKCSMSSVAVCMPNRVSC